MRPRKAGTGWFIRSGSREVRAKWRAGGLLPANKMRGRPAGSERTPANCRENVLAPDFRRGTEFGVVEQEFAACKHPVIEFLQSF